MSRLRFSTLALAGTAAAVALACGISLAESTPAGDKAVYVEIVTTAGDLVVALDAAAAPKTVANFLHYVDTGFYNGGTFFRAIPGFVIQGGNRPHERRSDAKLELEAPQRTGLRNTDGAISMARSTDPNSATSEFFICDGNQPTLDGSATQPGYAAFGHVVRGMDVVRKIVSLPAKGDTLVTPVKITKVLRVDEASSS